MNPVKYISEEEAVQIIQSNQRVYLHGSAATPVRLINALLKQKDRLNKVELVSISLKEVDLNDPSLEGHFYMNSLFVSESNRIAVNSNRGDYIPVFLSEISQLFARNILPLDVAMVHVSPPDKHGYCSLGPSVDIARSAVQNAKKVIAQVNPNIPRVHGDAFVDINRFDALVWTEDPLPEVRYDLTASETDFKIGNFVTAACPLMWW